MDFDEALNSPSVRTQSGAALFLRAEGPGAEKHLPKLLECCRAVDLTSKVFDKFQIALLGFGACTLGDIVRQIGFDPDDSFHVDVLNFIVELANTTNTELSAYAINALGCLGTTHLTAIDCLKRIVLSNKRSDDHSIVTRRAIAFRMLAQIDRSLATEFLGQAACQEYLNTIDLWLRDAGPSTQHSLVEEAKWCR